MKMISEKEMHRVIKERMISFGQILKSERIRAGLTHQELAFYAKMSCCKISNFENGLCENIEMFTIEKICAVLKIHPGIFFVEKKQRTINTED